MKNLIKDKRAEGFTIIEVMIVLAIAGLIMVIVFIAVPQLQKQQRNNARENVVNRVATEVNNFASNNNGKIPTGTATGQFGDQTACGVAAATNTFYQRYICNSKPQFQDPSTAALMVFTGSTQGGIDAAVAAAGNDTVLYATNAVCNGEVSAAGSANNFVVMNRLEGGAIHCVDNK
jgi:prepilin-type N-terminal cleavage/methylation domain-containing protein